MWWCTSKWRDTGGGADPLPVQTGPGQLEECQGVCRATRELPREGQDEAVLMNYITSALDRHPHQQRGHHDLPGDAD